MSSDSPAYFEIIEFIAAGTTPEAVAISLYFFGFLMVMKLGYKPFESLAVGILLGIAGGFVLVRPPFRNRIIPAHV